MEGTMKSARTNLLPASIRRILITCLAALIAFGMTPLTGCDSGNLNIGTQPSDQTVLDSSTSFTPASYEELYDLIEENGSDASGYMMPEVDIESREFAMEEEPTMAPSEDSASGSATNTGHSETNVQVAGIDEGDIVKTDGEYIYLISGTEIVIVRADGEATEEIARVTLDESKVLNALEPETTIYPRELYVDGTSLVVLYSYSPSYLPAAADDTVAPENEGSNSDAAEPEIDERSIAYPYYYRSVSEAARFDISDPHNPTYTGSFGQDGSYVSSRLHDGILYLISNYSVSYHSEMMRDQPETYVPHYYAEEEDTMIAAPDICILPDYESSTYSVISSIDVAQGTRIDQQSVFGASQTVYMSYDNLYLSGSTYKETEVDSYQDGSFTVTEYNSGSSTLIIKFSLDKGSVTYEKDTTIAGTLLNQFSLDEFENHLRVVTTVDNSRYRVLDDGNGEVTDYQSYESEPSSNALLIFDDALELTGGIEGLAEDERVYSVRFDGEVGYFVTFKQVDPLFAVDLSDPSNPQIKSSLKIPGFSTYMHVYSEDRLFGLGMAADEDGRTEGMKLSMFDTSNPYNISEKHTLALDSALDGAYSEALYNHKAILIEPAFDLIGIPSHIGYAIYGYSDKEGFYLREKIPQVSDMYYSSQRGLYLNEYLYICAENYIVVYTLDSLELVTELPIEVKNSGYQEILPL